MLNKISNLLLVVLTVTAFSTTTFAQKKLTEGEIKYEVTNVTSDNPQANQMMKGSKLTMTFAGEKSKIAMAFMGGMMQMDVLMEKGKGNTMLMNMMGRKIQVDGMAEDQGIINNPDDVTLKTFKSDKKNIVGYDCYKAILTNKDGSEITMYITDELQMNAANKEYFDKLFPKVKGFPLEYSVNQQGMKMTYQAKSLKKEVKSSAFDIPAGYEKMTKEEFEKQMGSMGGGMGF